jgi:hypothetical protein
MGVYHICSNKGPGVKICSAPGIIDFSYMYKVKNLKKSSVKKPKELEFKY